MKQDVPGASLRLGRWELVGVSEVPGPYSDEGIATVDRRGGRTDIVYTGTMSVTASLRAHGWTHVGDPDGWHGWLVTPYQAGAGTRAKMFEVTEPDGRAIRSIHVLTRGEAANNSFAAVTPDGRWTVSGEWGPERRLLVFPTPVVNPVARPGQPLRLAGTIVLKAPVTDVQGCAFSSGTRLFCTDASDLLELDLARPVRSGPVAATVRTLGSLPTDGGCGGPYEPEGVDVDRLLGQLRIEVSQPGICNLLTQVYEYRLPPAG